MLRKCRKFTLYTHAISLRRYLMTDDSGTKYVRYTDVRQWQLTREPRAIMML